jgi:hypothetical protein
VRGSPLRQAQSEAQQAYALRGLLLRQAHARGANQPLRWSLDKIAFRSSSASIRSAGHSAGLATSPCSASALRVTLQEVHDVIEPLLDYHLGATCRPPR